MSEKQTERKCINCKYYFRVYIDHDVFIGFETPKKCLASGIDLNPLVYRMQTSRLPTVEAQDYIDDPEINDCTHFEEKKSGDNVWPELINLLDSLK